MTVRQQVRLPHRTLLPAESWDYFPAKERFKENAVSMGVIAGYGLALSQIFNPLVLGGMVVLSIGIVARQAKKEAQEINEEYPNVPGLEPSDVYDRVHKHYSAVVDGFSNALKIPKQRFFYVNKDLLWATASLKDKIKLKYEDNYLKNALDNLAVSLSTSRLVLMSREFINKHPSAVANLVLAHESAHAKTNDSGRFVSKFWSVKKVFEKCSVPLIVGATLAAPFVSLFPSLFATGMNAVLGTSLLLVTSAAGRLGLNYVSRIMERRADRNAIFLTRDLLSATHFFASKSQNEPSMKKPKIFEIGTHPSFGHRLQNVQDAFKLASQYEVLNVSLPKPSEEVLNASSKERPYYRFRR